MCPNCTFAANNSGWLALIMHLSVLHEWVTSQGMAYPDNGGPDEDAGIVRHDDNALLVENGSNDLLHIVVGQEVDDLPHDR